MAALNGLNEFLSLNNYINNKIDNEIQKMENVSASNIDVLKIKFNSYPRPEKNAGKCDNLRSTEEIPTIYRHIFNNFQYFNSVQSAIFDDVFYTDCHLIVSAPTGSGKTVIFELAILELFMRLEDHKIRTDFKIVYIAPLKALCNEKFNDWTIKLEPLNIKCSILTGDSNVADLKELLPYQIIITTPEKWDSLTRKWRCCTELMESIKLFMIDEIHLLNENSRGPILEAIVSRMKTIIKLNQKSMYSTSQRKLYSGIRFVAASATIPNIEDLSIWLGKKEKVKYYRISDDLRPVKLDRYVFGFHCAIGMSDFRFDMNLSYRLNAVIQKHFIGKPVLIFCTTRKSVEMTSDVLIKNLYLQYDSYQTTNFQILAKKFQDKKLQVLIMKGVSYHHAGLSYYDRNLVESSFRNGLIPILLCTNTLAMGVNLPAHMVIIKSTETYMQGRTSELSESTILQMIGRAGRPQFDTSGTAIILTKMKNVKKYENLVSGTAAVESHLHKHLAEHLNSEITLNTITDLEIAMEWIRSTFLYVRAIKNPTNYGLTDGMNKVMIERKLEEICIREINALAENDLITKDSTSEINISSTVYGRLMARYYLSLDTMRLFKEIKGIESIEQIFKIIINCNEFTEYHLRVADKKTLNELNGSKCENEIIRFPIKGKIKNIANKTSCLLQAVLGNLHIKDVSLTQESQQMFNLAERITNCLLEYIRVSGQKFKNQHFNAILSSCILSKCFRAKLWENSQYVSRQFKSIGAAYSRTLASCGKTTIQQLLETDARHIESILGKVPPFGNQLLDLIKVLPQYTIILDRISSDIIKLKVVQRNKYYTDDLKFHNDVILIVGNSSNKLLLYADNVQFIITKYQEFERKIKFDKTDEFIKVFLIHQSLVGLDQAAQISIFESNSVYSMELNEFNRIVSGHQESNDIMKGNRNKNQKKIHFITASQVDFVIDKNLKRKEQKSKQGLDAKVSVRDMNNDIKNYMTEKHQNRHAILDIGIDEFISDSTNKLNVANDPCTNNNKDTQNENISSRLPIITKIENGIIDNNVVSEFSQKLYYQSTNESLTNIQNQQEIVDNMNKIDNESPKELSLHAISNSQRSPNKSAAAILLAKCDDIVKTTINNDCSLLISAENSIVAQSPLINRLVETQNIHKTHQTQMNTINLYYEKMQSQNLDERDTFQLNQHFNKTNENLLTYQSHCNRLQNTEIGQNIKNFNNTNHQPFNPHNHESCNKRSKSTILSFNNKTENIQKILPLNHIESNCSVTNEVPQVKNKSYNQNKILLFPEQTSNCYVESNRNTKIKSPYTTYLFENHNDKRDYTPRNSSTSSCRHTNQNNLSFSQRVLNLDHTRKRNKFKVLKMNLNSYQQSHNQCICCCSSNTSHIRSSINLFNINSNSSLESQDHCVCCQSLSNSTANITQNQMYNNESNKPYSSYRSGIVTPHKEILFSTIHDTCNDKQLNDSIPDSFNSQDSMRVNIFSQTNNEIHNNSNLLSYQSSKSNLSINLQNNVSNETVSDAFESDSSQVVTSFSPIKNFIYKTPKKLNYSADSGSKVKRFKHKNSDKDLNITTKNSINSTMNYWTMKTQCNNNYNSSTINNFFEKPQSINSYQSNMINRETHKKIEKFPLKHKGSVCNLLYYQSDIEKTPQTFIKVKEFNSKMHTFNTNHFRMSAQSNITNFKDGTKMMVASSLRCKNHNKIEHSNQHSYCDSNVAANKLIKRNLNYEYVKPVKVSKVNSWEVSKHNNFNDDKEDKHMMNIKRISPTNNTHIFNEVLEEEARLFLKRRRFFP